MAKLPIATCSFALVVVKFENRFLLTQERKHGETWYLPAGSVETGETLIAAAHRETLEETGIRIELTGILRVEHTPLLETPSQLRVFFLANPVGPLATKQVPDNESLRAEWVALKDLFNYPLRDEEVREILAYVDAGGIAYPLTLLQSKRSPW